MKVEPVHACGVFVNNFWVLTDKSLYQWSEEFEQYIKFSLPTKKHVIECVGTEGWDWAWFTDGWLMRRDNGRNKEAVERENRKSKVFHDGS